METPAAPGAPASTGRCPPRTHFHIALAGVFVPLVGLVTAAVLAFQDRAHPGQDAEHRRWTRRLFALVGVDLLVVVCVLAFHARREEPEKALSGPVARIEPGPRIGVIFDPATPDALISKVLPDLPAARAGVRPGDRVISIDGIEVKTSEQLRESILRGAAGTPRRLGITRGGDYLELEVTPVVPGVRRLMDTTAGKTGIPWVPGMVWIGSACAMAAIARIVARRRGAPRIAIWRVVLLAFAGAMGAALGVMAAAKAAMGGASIFGLILGVYGQMLAILLITGAAMKWVAAAPVPADPGRPVLSRTRVTLSGLLYVVTGFLRAAVLLATFESLVLKGSPPPNAIEWLLKLRLGAAGSFMLAAVVVVIGPIAEEVLFRGFLLPRLAAQIGTRWALWASALLFAALHYEYGIHTLLILYYGLVLGWARLRSGGLASPILLHMAINGVVMAVFLLRA